MAWRVACLCCAAVLLTASANAAEPEMGKPKHAGPGYLTWVGFAKSDTDARVFVRLSSPLQGSVGQARAGDDLVVTIPGYKLDTKNHARPLDTRFFGTDVVRVAAKPTKVGVE